ncbi:MAG: hypothetical protein PHU31_08565 [Anaerotignum sp.]|nr:hypothetical protein [Anaerotignum sp.]
MKKTLLLILAVVMSFAFVACGGGENDENNAAVQAKFDEADSLLQEIRGCYEDKGYLEGDTAAEVEVVLDALKAPIEQMKAAHQDILDMGGYTDEDMVTIEPILDTTITELNKVIADQAAYDASAEEGTGIAAVGEKYNQLYDIVMEASDLATTNGWMEDEAFSSELDASLAIMEIAKADLDNPESIDEAYMNELSAAFDELIPVWQDYLTQLSEPYTGN